MLSWHAYKSVDCILLLVAVARLLSASAGYACDSIILFVHLLGEAVNTPNGVSFV